VIRRRLRNIPWALSRRIDHTLILGNGLYRSDHSEFRHSQRQGGGPRSSAVLPNTRASTPPWAPLPEYRIAGFRSPYTQQGDIAIERHLGKDLADHGVVHLEPRFAPHFSE